MEIKVLGTGCPKCNRLEGVVKEVVREIDADITVKKVSNFKDIALAGVMITPALMIDGKVVVSGEVPSKQDIAKMIKEGLDDK